LDYRDHVRHDDRFERPAEVDLLCGDATHARETIGWQPQVRFAGLVQLMVEAEVRRLAEDSQT
ncbi:MAG: GDP-mannose 4,6-dehydratase, partial [Dehalococcoidia bacterium]